MEDVGARHRRRSSRSASTSSTASTTPPTRSPPSSRPGCSRPRLRGGWAAFFNFVAFLVFGTHVATTIAKDVVVQDVLSIGVIFAGLVGAIGWNLITFYLGLPTSSSHALVGGIAGAAVAKAGFDVLVGRGPAQDRRVHRAVAADRPRRSACILTVVIAVDVPPRAGSVDRLNRGFRRGQLVSAAAFSLGHGANDAQKTMGIILAVLIAGGHAAARTPTCRCGSCSSAHTAIGLGTLSGGWRIVKTMGSKITRLQPVGRRGRRVGGGRHAVLHVGAPASRCRRPTRSPAPSSASAPPGGCRRCGGASPAGSCGRGSSPSPARSPSRRSPTGSWRCFA